jgi:putative hemolysin
VGGYWVTVLLLGVLVLLNAVFAGSEIALISLREGQLRQLERRGGAGAELLVRLAKDPNRFLATTQIGITLAGFLASATAALSLAEPLAPVFAFLGGAAKPVAVGVITLALTFVTLVLGELAPKRVAMQYALGWALVVARPLDWLSRLSRPAVLALGRTTDLVVRIVGADPNVTREELSPAELREVVASLRDLNPEQRAIITGALDIHERLLREVLVPRRAVFMLAAETPVAKARADLAASGHSRAPVVRDGDLDTAVGVVHLKDLLDDGTTLAEVLRAPVVFPNAVRVADALRRLRDEREHFALIANEHGAIDGIVTLEDLLEEVVGEIYDETDPDVVAVRTQPGGELVLPGTFPVHDLPGIGVEIQDAPDIEYATIAGLVLAVLGQIPSEPGDRAELTEWIIEVTAIDGKAITEVRLLRRPAA